MQIQAVLIVCVPPEFIDSAGEGVGFVVWADATKLGRLSNNDLNTMCDSMANVHKEALARCGIFGSTLSMQREGPEWFPRRAQDPCHKA